MSIPDPLCPQEHPDAVPGGTPPGLPAGVGDYTAERQRQYRPALPGEVEALGAELMRDQAAGRLGHPLGNDVDRPPPGTVSE